MDIEIRKYIQYKVRTLNKRKWELTKLRARREELRREILDESPLPPDGQPKGKGSTSSPVESKVLRLEKMEQRIDKIDRELTKFKEIERKIKLMGRIPRTIYLETIVGTTNPDIIIGSLCICRTEFYNVKKGLLEFIASELGEFLDE